MEEIFKLLSNKKIYDSILSSFKIEGYSMEIDINNLKNLVYSVEGFKEGFLALNLEGDTVSSYKSSLLTDVRAVDIDHLLGNVFPFDPTTNKRDVVYTNYLDAIINWHKIPVTVPVLSVGDDRVLLDTNYHYALPVLPIEVTPETSMNSLQTLNIKTISEYIGLHEGSEAPSMLSCNMISSLVFSPLLLTLVRVDISEEKAAELQQSGSNYIIESFEDYTDNLINKITINLDDDSIPDPFAKALGVLIKYFLNSK